MQDENSSSNFLLPISGQILAPAEYNRVLKRLGHKGQIGQYGLYSTMSEAMTKTIFAGEPVQSGVRIYITPLNMHVLVVTVQAGTCQSRISLDLHDELTRIFLRSALQYQGISVLLVSKELDMAALYAAEFTNIEEHEDILREAEAVSLPWPERVEQHAGLCAELTQDMGMITFAAAPPIEEVQVTVILPPEPFLSPQ